MSRISLGPSSTDRDVFESDDLIALVARVNGYLAGDVNGDLRITVADCLRALRIAVGAIPNPTECELAAVDVDGLCGVSVRDALRLLRYAVVIPGVTLELSRSGPCGPE